jgi:exonuclease SbcD
VGICETVADHGLEDHHMKVLLFSDLHLDTPFKWAGPELARARRQGLRDTLTRICALALEHNVDALACGGDLYEHERYSPDTGEFLRTTFAGLDRPVLLAPGNHDWFGPASLYAQLDWSPKVYVFTADRLAAYELADGFTVWGAAHRAPANTDGFLEHFTVGRSGLNVGLFHGSERGGLPFQESGKTPHAPFSAAQIPAAGLAHAMLGHFHTPKDGEHHTYPGNPDPLSFGEVGVRGAVLLDFADTGALSRTRLDVASALVQDVVVTLAGPTNAQEVRDQVGAALAPLTGIVRVTVTGEVGPELDLQLGDLSDLGAHLQSLVTRLGLVHVSYDFEALAKEKTVRGLFVHDVLASDQLDDAGKRRVLVTGLRALDGRGQELEVH